jgi:threonine 3-dehydrogenase
MSATMMALRKTRAALGAEMQEVKIPDIKANEVLVKVQATSVCGTDIHIYSWDKWAQNRIKRIPYTIGHETSGVVIKAGSAVTRVQEGDTVSVETHIPCMKCKQCLTGQMHVCANVQILGVDRDGAMAEYLAVPDVVCWKNDPSIPPEFLAIQEPLGNAVHCTLIEPVHGKSVAIYGDGPIGIFAVGVARACGATKVILAGLDPFRMELGKKLGADLVIDVSKENSVDVIKRETEGIGADVVLEMSGAAQAMREGINALRYGGRFCFFGIYHDELVEAPLNDIIFNGGRFYGINGRLMFDTWFTVKNLIGSGRLDLSPVVTHKMPMSKYAEAFDMLIEKKQPVGKIVLFPG